MELTQVSLKIGEKIEELERYKAELPYLSKKKADTMVEYEKALARGIVGLANAPATTAEKIARGNCADLKGEMDLAESSYKNCLKVIDITQAQLNGYQSINRYLAET